MEKEQRSKLQTATQDARKLLEEEFRSQLLQTYDIDVEKMRWAEEPGAHLEAEQRLIREKLVAWIEHKEAQIKDRKEALLLALREMAFTALNRFVALKLMEARELVRPCVSGGLESAGFQDFTAVAQELLADQESSYRLFLETIFEDVSRELRALFDPRDPASLLWPKRPALLELLDILNRPELAALWIEDETLGWVYQYFNGHDERKKMRDESSAPRNSRELAVRNQFFTPRYVVEFLTDNTLGRIWYEMRQGKTGLKDCCRYLVRGPNEVWLQPGEEPPAQADADEALSQEELLRQLEYIPHRPLKDPREIRMLDPACGSMHFGLYAFDLYLDIYAEAWEIIQGSDDQAKQGETFGSFAAYAANFDGKADFLREVPRLILMHNIHGIDIDPRAAQIAKLTLWLRAQRAWKEQQLEVAIRPPITRSNVVCAEPMPGERELLVDFVDQQFHETESGLVQRLLEEVFSIMHLAGEAGSLLKVEEDIRDAIDQARREWQELATHQPNLFSGADLTALGQLGASLNDDLQRLTSDFWVDIEERIYVALSEYAKQAESSGGLERRLFSDDAAQGFAFIDISRKRYDVVVMNPPFGAATEKTKAWMRRTYQFCADNLLISFLCRFTEILSGSGLLGCITDRSWLQKYDYRKFRGWVVGQQCLQMAIDLGWGVLDAANVETAVSIFGKRRTGVITFGNVSGIRDEKKLTFPFANHFIRSPQFFNIIPNISFSYSINPRVYDWFREDLRVADQLVSFQGGIASWDVFQTVRCYWEVAPDAIGLSRQWAFVQAGSPYAPFYYPTAMLTLCEGGSFGVILSNPTASTPGRWLYGRPGVGFGKRTDSMYSYAMPGGGAFSWEGQAGFCSDDAASTLFQALGFTNSSAYIGLSNLVAGQHKYAGYLNTICCDLTRLPDVSAAAESVVTELMSWDTANECSLRFVSLSTFSPLDLRVEMSQRMSILKDRTAFVVGTHQSISGEVAQGLGVVGIFDSIPQYQPFASIFGQEYASQLSAAFVVSYAVGTAFGRWDIRFATGERPAPDLPDPFAPLPVCPPGMLQGEDGLPLSPEDGRQLRTAGCYPLDVSWESILVDDPDHPLDIERCVHAALDVLWGDRCDALEHEASSELGGSTLREWFRRPAGFFADHLKRYTKSRRQAPIYWQLSVGSGSYSVWLYYHRFTQDTLFRVLRDFIEPRIQHTEKEQLKLESTRALSEDAASQLQETQTLLQDLRILKSELDLVSHLWSPNLNDGVIINHSILWRITAFTPWQKKCKECWDKLRKGDYDWAHLAFHLWPERVIPNCVTDRSLAIAHGLEERLWQETNNGNWLPRQLSDSDLLALIAEHSDPAVKSALERFLAAPPPMAPTRARSPRITRSTASGTTRKPRGSNTVVDAEATRQTLLVLTDAPAEGLSRNAIAEFLGVEAASLTAVIKQLKATNQIEQLGAARGARYVLSEQGRAAVAADAGGEA